MITVDQALAKVLSVAKPTPPERLAAAAALGRTLAEDIASDVDSPPHDKATVDGYAVVAADLAGGAADVSVLEEITAGAMPTRKVASGQTSRVMTGAPIPPGADAMVMIERSEPLPSLAGAVERVRLRQDAVRAGQNINRRASSLARGDVVLRQGARIRAIEVGLLAEVGRHEILVHRRASVAVLATGNELVQVNETPPPGKIRNSNGPLLMAAVERAAAMGRDLGIARDDRDELAAAIADGLECDVLLISGGVSAGVLDLIPGALRAAGAEQVFHEVRLKPGRPLWFGMRQAAGRTTLVFGLPGNPVSSLVCFELFVRPALARLSGSDPVGLRQTVARLSSDFLHRGDRPTYYPGRLRHDQVAPVGSEAVLGLPDVEPLAWQGSGDLRTLADATVLIHFPAGDHAYPAGTTVAVLLLE